MPAVSEKQREAMAIAEHHPSELYARNKGMKKMTHGQLHDFATTKGLKKGEFDLTKLSAAELDYLEGFVQKCAELGADPEAVLVKMSAEDPSTDTKEDDKEEKKPEGKVKKTVKHVAGGVARGAAAGGVVGAGLGAAAGGMARSVNHTLQHHLHMAIQGAKAGGSIGAVQGGMMGGVVRAAQ